MLSRLAAWFRGLARPEQPAPVSSDLVVGPAEFRRLVLRERARSDRNGGALALVLVDGGADAHLTRALETWSSAIAARVRCTDAVGWFDARTLGVALPDTDHEGALVVIRQLRAHLPPEAVQANWRILVHPEHTASLPTDRPATGDSNDPLDLLRAPSRPSRMMEPRVASSGRVRPSISRDSEGANALHGSVSSGQFSNGRGSKDHTSTGLTSTGFALSGGGLATAVRPSTAAAATRQTEDSAARRWTSQLPSLSEFTQSLAGAPQVAPAHQSSAEFHAEIGSLQSALVIPTSPLKRAVDIVGASLALVAFSPVMLTAMLAVRLSSPGPVLFRQRRAGLGGRPFDFYKFRTMYVDAEQRKQDLLAQNEMSGPVFKIAADPRITRVGRFLRKASIDELPQLWNVLKGDMSLVGPRPPIVAEVAEYDRWQRRRLDIQGGLTCIWQVSGRSAIQFDDWVRLDLRYVRTASLATDLGILVRTVPAVLTGRGAH